MTIDRQRVAAVDTLVGMGYVWAEGKWNAPLAQESVAPRTKLHTPPMSLSGSGGGNSSIGITSVTTQNASLTHTHTITAGNTGSTSSYPTDPWARFVKAVIEMEQALATMYPNGGAGYVGIKNWFSFQHGARLCASYSGPPNGLPLGYHVGGVMLTATQP